MDPRTRDVAPLTPATCLAHLDRAVDDFAAVLDRGDLDAPVPGCSPWTVTDLAHHLGGIHRWARTAVVERRAGAEEVDGAPTDRAALTDWFRTGAGELTSALRVADPDAPAWAMAPPPTVGFWIRRQAHETAMHARDAQAACGSAAPLPADLALDGMDEVVGMFLPRQVGLGRIPAPAVPVVLAADEGGTVAIGPDAPPVATVRGPAEALLLLLWHRVPLDDPRLTVSGDRAAAATVLAAALTP